MILGQEPTAQTVLPVGLKLGDNAFELLNELNVFLVVITIVIIKEFFSARSQGQDEGSPAIYALKQVEKHFVSVVVIFVLFWAPYSSPQKISVNSFKCNAPTQTAQVPVPAFAKQPSELPIGWILTNNLSAGFSETLSSQLPCDDALNSIKNSMSTALIEIDDPNLVYLIQQHYQQCFMPAQNRIAEAKAQDRLSLLEPYSTKKNYLTGSNTMAGYDGLYSTDGVHSQLRMSIREDYWKKMSSSKNATTDTIDGYTVLSVPCADAATTLNSDVKTYVSSNYPEEINRLYEINSSFKQSQANSYSSKGEATSAYTHQAYIDSATGKAQLLNPDVEITENSGGIMSSAWTTLKESVQSLTIVGILDSYGVWEFLGLTDKSGEIVDKQYGKSIETLAYFGMQTERLIQASKVTSINTFLPIFVTVTLAIVYAATPILLMLSGYSWKMIKAMAILIFTLHFTFYILNLATTFESVISAMANSELGWYAANLSTTGSALQIVSSYSLIAAVLTWLALCVIVGLRLGPLLTGLINISGAAGEAGAKSAIAAVKAAATRGKA